MRSQAVVPATTVGASAWQGGGVGQAHDREVPDMNGQSSKRGTRVLAHREAVPTAVLPCSAALVMAGLQARTLTCCRPQQQGQLKVLPTPRCPAAASCRTLRFTRSNSRRMPVRSSGRRRRRRSPSTVGWTGRWCARREQACLVCANWQGGRNHSGRSTHLRWSAAPAPCRAARA